MNRRDFVRCGAALAGGALMGVSPEAWADDRIKGDLTHLRQEEKLARDLYLELYEQWGLRPFANTAESEQRHMDAVGQQLAAMGWDDPVAGLKRGEFLDRDLQQLYDDLRDDGSRSELAALRVGATVEDLDIADLDAMRGRTDHEGLLATYGLLRCGSENHMRAFVGQLRARGESYSPSHIAQAELDRILAAPHGGCGGGGGRGRGGGWGGGRGPGWGRGR